MDKIIWIFREPRSGSTWFSQKLCRVLGRQFYFFDTMLRHYTVKEREEFYLNRQQEKDDYKRILNTHNFFALKSLKNYYDPIVFRVARKDKTEQFVSGYISQIYKHSYFNVTSEEDIKSLPQFERLIIPKSDIQNYIHQTKKIDNLWQTYCNEYKSQTFFYEDFTSEFDIPMLDVYKLKMTNNEVDNPTIKLPYNKTELVVNYKQVQLEILKAFDN